MVDSITAVGAQTLCTLFLSICDLKDTQMNMQHSLIQKFIFYVFELNRNAMEADKNICDTKGDGAVDHTTGTRRFKKFCSDYKNFDNQARSSRPKTVDSNAIL